MGMYTEFHLYVRLKKGVPENVIHILRNITNSSPVVLDIEDMELPNHPFFKTRRWELLGRCGSASFPFHPYSTVEFDDEYRDVWLLQINSNLKNYDEEIQKFLHWLHPYVDETDEECVGYYRGEGSWYPTVIMYFDKEFGSMDPLLPATMSPTWEAQ